MITNVELIKNILKLCDNEEAYNVKLARENQSFFDIIGRSKDECLISRMLAYALKRDKRLFSNLMAFYNNRNNKTAHKIIDYEITDIKCEKIMWDGRADIFVKGQDCKGNPCTLTIENKIDTYEHYEQTKNYYNYVITNYNSYNNAFLFLKPDYNYSPISCNNFLPINYSELLKLIDDTTGDIFINDFCRHIKDKLTVKEVAFMEIDTLILENYAKFKELIREADNKFINFKQNLFNDICQCIQQGGLDIGYDIKSRKPNSKFTNQIDNENNAFVISIQKEKLQIYRDKWYYYSDFYKMGYYFYVEVLFKDNDPNNILFQKVARGYGKNDEIRKFCKECEESFDDGFDPPFTVFKSVKFSAESRLFSPEWKEHLKNLACEKLIEFISEMDGTFDRFKKWKAKK